MATLALSSGESELGAVVRASGEGLGIQSILCDFGHEILNLTKPSNSPD